MSRRSPASINNWAPDPTSGTSKSYTNPDTQNADVLPSGDALLVAQATCEGVTRQAWCIVAFPMFPYAIAAAGNINSSGSSLEVVGVKGTTTTPQQALTSPDPNVKAGIASNSSMSGTGATAAIDLGDLTRITGTAQAVGTVYIPSGLAPGNIGTIAPYSAPVALPTITVTDLDPTSPTSVISGQTSVGDNIPASIQGGFKYPSTSGLAGQPTTVGNLDLNQGVLYVDGDLHITGALNGFGVVIVHGSVQIDNGSTFTAGQSQAAVIASGNVTVNGGSTANAAFTGLIYSQGTFTANNITLMGGFAGTSPSNPVTLVNVPGVIQDPDLTTFHMSVNQPAPPPTGPTGGANGNFGPLGTNFTVYYNSPTEPVDTMLPANGTFWIGEYPQANGSQPCSVSGNPSQLDQAVADYLNSLATHGTATEQAYYSSHPVTAAQIAAWDIAGAGSFHGNVDAMALNGTMMSVSNKVYPGAPPPTGTPTVTRTGANFSFDLNQFIDIGDTTRVLLWNVK